jgi:septal ring factor EnvC (AmiA/AmiB activator)
MAGCTEDGEIAMPPELKAGRLIQLGLQYLMHTLEKMRENNRALQQTLDDKKSGVENLHATLFRQEELLSHLRRQRRELAQLLDSHHRVLDWSDPEAARKIKQQHWIEEQALEGKLGGNGSGHGQGERRRRSSEGGKDG